jgi:nicotinate-nucleotide adenylyltransferase
VEKNLYSPLASPERIEKAIEQMNRHIDTALREKRRGHSLRVADTAEELCRLFGLDPRRGRLAGLAHDMAKELDTDEIARLAAQDGAPLIPAEEEKPALLHGRAAAVLLSRDFGINDEDIREAVANHTFGKPLMCDLAKVLYIADKLEPGREYASPEYLAKFQGMGLNRMLREVLQDNLASLERKQKTVVAVSYDLLKSLEALEAAEAMKGT